MTQLLDWDAIILTEEYETELALMNKIIVKGIANDGIVDSDNVFVQVMSHMLAVQRYLIKHVPSIKDLDESAFFEYMQKEVGFFVPTIDEFPISEFMKENKRWFGHKGTEVLYEFLGSLIGSPIEVYYPKDLIFKLDNIRCKLDGGESTKGVLPFKISSLAHIRDGIFWANFTYVVHVMQGQLVTNQLFLNAILKTIHPAGTKMFLSIDDWSVSEYIDNDLAEGSKSEGTTSFYAFKPYPGLDNGFILDDLNCLLDQLGGFAWVNTIDIQQSRDEAFFYGYRMIHWDTLLHEYPTDDPSGIFFLWVQDSDDTYKKQYADENADILLIQQTNMSFEELTLGDIEGRSMRELANIAMGNKGKSPDTPWFRDLTLVDIVEIP